MVKALLKAPRSLLPLLRCNLNKTARADDDLRLLRDHIDAEAAGTLQLEYHAGMFHQTVVESANWYQRS